MYNYAARIMYDGTEFCGWQLQQRPQGKPSVQKVGKHDRVNCGTSQDRILRLSSLGAARSLVHDHTTTDKADQANSASEQQLQSCTLLQVIEAALLKKQLQPHRDALRLQASSRTDSGVHAECQVS